MASSQALRETALLVPERLKPPVDAFYSIVYLDCIVVKIQQDKKVINKVIYLAQGVNMDGQKGRSLSALFNDPQDIRRAIYTTNVTFLPTT